MAIFKSRKEIIELLTCSEKGIKAEHLELRIEEGDKTPLLKRGALIQNLEIIVRNINLRGKEFNDISLQTRKEAKERGKVKTIKAAVNVVSESR